MLTPVRLASRASVSSAAARINTVVPGITSRVLPALRTAAAGVTSRPRGGPVSGATPRPLTAMPRFASSSTSTYGTQPQGQEGSTCSSCSSSPSSSSPVVVSPFHDIPLWADRSNGVANMLVEIPRGTRAKMEISKDEKFNPIKQDEKKGKLRFVAWNYPFNYGAVPQTWENPQTVHPSTNAAGDNDPVDICELSEHPIPMGAVRAVKVLGAYAMIDEGETDWKIVCIDARHPKAGQLHDIGDVDRVLPGRLEELYTFLRDYKTPDGKPQNQFAFEGRPQNREFAIGVLEETHHDWKQLIDGSVEGKQIALERTCSSTL